MTRREERYISENMEALNLEMLQKSNADYLAENQRLQAELEPLRKLNDDLAEENKQLTQRNQDMTTESKLQNMDSSHLEILQKEVEERDREIGLRNQQIETCKTQIQALEQDNVKLKKRMEVEIKRQVTINKMNKEDLISRSSQVTRGSQPGVNVSRTSEMDLT